MKHAPLTIFAITTFVSVASARPHLAVRNEAQLMADDFKCARPSWNDKSRCNDNNNANPGYVRLALIQTTALCSLTLVGPMTLAESLRLGQSQYRRQDRCRRGSVPGWQVRRDCPGSAGRWLFCYLVSATLAAFLGQQTLTTTLRPHGFARPASNKISDGLDPRVSYKDLCELPMQQQVPYSD